MNDPRDATGVWYGRYFATGWDVPENSFIAHLERSEERRVGEECRSRGAAYH